MKPKDNRNARLFPAMLILTGAIKSAQYYCAAQAHSTFRLLRKSCELAQLLLRPGRDAQQHSAETHESATTTRPRGFRPVCKIE